jgi:predicted Abi (CAAX) family protease
VEYNQEDQEPVKDATPIIQWLISMGWEPDAEKIERLQEIIRNREPARQPRGVSAKWKDKRYGYE